MKTKKVKLTNILVFAGLLFTTARMIRGTDSLYILALISFAGIWILNYRLFWDLNFKRSVIWFLPFGLWAVLSSIWSLEPFISFSRGVFYIFISSTSVMIGFIYRNRFIELMKLSVSLNALFIFLSVISLISGIPSDAWTANHGMGFTSIFIHQNTLAAVLMFTLIGPTYFLLNCFHGTLLDGSFRTEQSKREKSYKNQKDLSVAPLLRDDNEKGLPAHQSSRQVIPDRLLSLSKYNRAANKGAVIPVCLKPESIFYFLLLLLNFYFIYLSYSRAVMLSLFVGGLVLIYMIGSLKFNLVFTLFMILFGTFIFTFFGPQVNSYLKKSAPDYFGRRMILWEPSYQAAINGGVFGLGYGVTDPSVESGYKKENKFCELKREKGNSILALIEEVGIIGLCLFLITLAKIATLYFSSYKKSVISYQLSEKSNPSLITHYSSLSPFHFLFLPFSFLIAFFIHAQFEAWFVGVSSFYLLSFLIVSCLAIE